MNTLDDLRSTLDSYASRGEERGADAVWEAITTVDGGTTTAPSHEPRSRRLLLTVAAAAVLILIVSMVAIVRSRAVRVDVVTTPDTSLQPPDSTDPTAAPASVALPGGMIRNVFLGFDRTWVVTTEHDDAGSPTPIDRSHR